MFCVRHPVGRREKERIVRAWRKFTFVVLESEQSEQRFMNDDNINTVFEWLWHSWRVVVAMHAIGFVSSWRDIRLNYWCVNSISLFLVSALQYYTYTLLLDLDSIRVRRVFLYIFSRNVAMNVFAAWLEPRNAYRSTYNLFAFRVWILFRRVWATNRIKQFCMPLNYFHFQEEKNSSAYWLLVDAGASHSFILKVIACNIAVTIPIQRLNDRNEWSDKMIMRFRHTRCHTASPTNSRTPT